MRMLERMCITHTKIEFLETCSLHSNKYGSWVILTIKVTKAGYSEKSKSSSLLPQSGMIVGHSTPNE